jgi:selenocysteine-specific translation elongation factor
VGLALKGIDSEELDRGYVLTNDPTIKCDARILSKARLVRYWQAPIKEGMVFHIGHWMQFMPARVVAVDSASDFRTPSLELVLEKELVHSPNSRAVLTYLDGGKLRIAGTIELP